MVIGTQKCLFGATANGAEFNWLSKHEGCALEETTDDDAESTHCSFALPSSHSLPTLRRRGKKSQIMSNAWVDTSIICM